MFFFRRRKSEPPAETASVSDVPVIHQRGAITHFVDTTPVRVPLAAYLSAPTWDESLAVFAQHQELLCSDTALTVMRDTIAQLMQQSGATQMDANMASLVAFLEDAHVRGFIAAKLTKLAALWVALPTWRAKRRFLNAHHELLAPEIDQALAQVQADLAAPQAAFIVQQHQLTLQYLRATDGSSKAIHQAWVNLHGGLVLDVPQWFEEIETYIAALEQSARSAETNQKRIKPWATGLERLGHEGLLTDELAAAITMHIAETYIAQQTPEAQAIGAELLGEVQQTYTIVAYPVQWARSMVLMQHNAMSFVDSDAGLCEVVIGAVTLTLPILTREAFPIDWAYIQMLLGNAYSHRGLGIPLVNYERAIAYYQAVFEVFTRETFPEGWAGAHYNLGLAYTKRELGSPQANRHQAVRHYTSALEVWTPESSLEDWLETQNVLGNALLDLSELEVARQSVLREEAITHFELAIAHCAQDAFPTTWTLLHQNLGNCYQQRQGEDRAANLVLAKAQYEAVLQVRTPQNDPTGFRDVTRMLAELEGTLGDWASASNHFLEIIPIEGNLLSRASTEIQMDSILNAGGDWTAHAGYAFAQLGDAATAACILEYGRGQRVEFARLLAARNPYQITDPGLQKAFDHARQKVLDLYSYDRVLNTSGIDPEVAWAISEYRPLGEVVDDGERAIQIAQNNLYRQAFGELQEVIQQIRATQISPDADADRLSEADILPAAPSVGHAIAYLVATRWGGLMVAGINTGTENSGRFVSLTLPELTDEAARAILWDVENTETNRLLSGWVPAIEGDIFDRFVRDWAGESDAVRHERRFGRTPSGNRMADYLADDQQTMTFADVARLLHATCQAQGLASTLDVAVQKVLSLEKLQVLVDVPLVSLTARELNTLTKALRYQYLQEEIARCQAWLQRTLLPHVHAWLSKEGVEKLTLISYGDLGILPVLTTPIIADGQTLGSLFSASSLPSARVFNAAPQPQERAGIFALGDPGPPLPSLQWGEAEAHTVARMGGDASHVATGDKANRAWLIETIKHAEVMDIATHGQFDGDFLKSRLLLARGQFVTLGEILGGIADVHGIRLVVLSACQSAALDARRARNEIRSLPAGLLQAGAQAVIGALWPVDDLATYLLITRFMRLWLPHKADMPPAQALAAAQHWLRTVTYLELETWNDLPKEATEEDLEAMITQSTMRYLPDGDGGAVERIQGRAKGIGAKDNTVCPYADPYYWAAFQLMGW